MMKKTALLIGSVAAVALLAGGTFAAYTITDNANPFGVKISPSAIEEEKFGSVELNWGENTVQKVEDLAAAQTKKIGNLILKADKKDDKGVAILEDYIGTLTVSIEDKTVYPELYSGAKLIDNIEIYVVADDLGVEASLSAERVGTLPTGSPKVYSGAYEVAGNAAGKTYSVFVKLADISGTVYSQIKNHVVYVGFDWSKKASDAEEADTKTVYVLDNTGDSGDLYAYAWGGGKENAAYPGVKMTEVASHYYSVELPDSMANVIFGRNADDKKTEDIAIDDDKPYYTLSAGYAYAASADKPVIAAYQYYVTGQFNGVEKWGQYIEELGMNDDAPANIAKIEHVALGVGDKVKVINYVSAGEPNYYGPAYADDVNFSIDGDGNAEVLVAGNYTIYLNNEYGIWLAKEA